MVKKILYKKIEVLALKTEIFLDELLSRITQFVNRVLLLLVLLLLLLRYRSQWWLRKKHGEAF